MQPRERLPAIDRLMRFVATFAFTAGAVMIGTRSTRFGTWEPWLLAAIGAGLLLLVTYRLPLDAMRDSRTGDPLFESPAQRNVVFGTFLLITFVILGLIGRLMASTM